MIRATVLLILLSRCYVVYSFHVFYDTALWGFHPSGSTARCSVGCPAGEGCVVHNNSAVCARCRSDEVSAEGAAACQSCTYGDQSSWGYWSKFVKQELEPSATQSQCEVIGSSKMSSGERYWFAVKLWLTWGMGSLCAGLVFVFLLYFIYWNIIAERKVHRLLRKQMWVRAAALLNEIYKKDTNGRRSVAELACRQGRDGKSALEIALDLGTKLGYTLVGPREGRETQYPLRPINRHQRPSSTSASRVDIPGSVRIGSESIDNHICTDEENWRRTTNAMLYPGGEQEHRDVDRLDSRSESQQNDQRKCCTPTVAVHLLFGPACVAGVTGEWIFYGSIFGAVIDQGNLDGISPTAPENLQECALWCTLFGVGEGIGVGIVLLGPVIYFLIKETLAKWVHTIAQRTNDPDSASALLSFTFVLGCVWIVTIGDGIIYFKGIGGAIMAMGCSCIVAVAFAPYITSKCIVLVKQGDPYATVLKRMLRGNVAFLKKWKTTSMSSIWPFMRASLLYSPDSSSTMWELFLPLNAKPPAIERATKAALQLIEHGPERTGAMMVHTLMKAAISRVASVSGCAKCIENILAIHPSARLLRAEGEKHSPADLAIATVKSIDVKKAALIVLFDRIAVVDLDVRIYESATCRVYRAEDLGTGRIVAIKLFAHAAHFNNEVAMRDSLNFAENTEMAYALVQDYANLRRDWNAAQFERTRPYPNSAWKADIAESLFGVFKGGAIVMPLADYDLHHRLNFSRIAGIDAAACIDIIRPIVHDLHVLHEHHTVHTDVKPRNIVFVGNTWKLIDLDAAKTIGSSIDTSAKGFKWTSGFACPELARCRTAEPKGTLIADPKMDVFSLGILVCELLTGQPLFPQDTCNNSMVDTAYVHVLAPTHTDNVRFRLTHCPN